MLCLLFLAQFTFCKCKIITNHPSCWPQEKVTAADKYLSSATLLEMPFSQGPQVVKNLHSCRRHKKCEFDAWVRKIPWSMKWQPSLEFLLEKSHGQRSLVDYSPWGHKESDMTEYIPHTHTHTHLFCDSLPGLLGTITSNSQGLRLLCRPPCGAMVIASPIGMDRRKCLGDDAHDWQAWKCESQVSLLQGRQIS